jgi:hypothetical protein
MSRKKGRCIHSSSFKPAADAADAVYQNGANLVGENISKPVEGTSEANGPRGYILNEEIGEV